MIDVRLVTDPIGLPRAAQYQIPEMLGMSEQLERSKVHGY